MDDHKEPMSDAVHAILGLEASGLTDAQKETIKAIPLVDGDAAVKHTIEELAAQHAEETDTPGHRHLQQAKELGAYQYDLLGGFLDHGFDPQVMQKLRDNGATGKQLCEGMLYEVLSANRELYDLMPALAPIITTSLKEAGHLDPAKHVRTVRLVEILLMAPQVLLGVVSEMQRQGAFDQDRAAAMHQRMTVTKVNMTQ